MNLKNTIDNPNKHTNDLKLAKQKINDRIISGGGSIANTISAVPEAIDRMLGNYKKTIILNRNDVLISGTGSINKNISINIPFVPTKIFITLEIQVSSSSTIQVSFNNLDIIQGIRVPYGGGHQIYLEINKPTCTKTNLNISGKNNGYINSIKLKRIVAIE